MMTDTTPNKVISKKKTSNSTLAATHLARLVILEDWCSKWARQPREMPVTNATIKMVGGWAKSVRWATEKKTEPAWKAVTEKAFAKLTTLEEDWDSYGGLPIDPANIIAARLVLDQIMKHDTPPPHVTPMSCGSVQLEWSMKGVDLEIEIEDITVSEGDRIRFCHILYLSPRDAVGDRDEWEGIRSLDELNCLHGMIEELSG